MIVRLIARTVLTGDGDGLMLSNDDHRSDAGLLVEFAGRVCSDKIAETFTGEFVQRRIQEEHYSILEHASFTFFIVGISRACLAQLTRHRHASFSVESQRYAGARPFYVIPRSIANSAEAVMIMAPVMTQAIRAYSDLVALGIKPEDARFATTQAAATRLVLTMNARSLLEFFAKRIHPAAQWEIRELAEKMKELVSPMAPEIFEEQT